MHFASSGPLDYGEKCRTRVTQFKGNLTVSSGQLSIVAANDTRVAQNQWNGRNEINLETVSIDGTYDLCLLWSVATTCPSTHPSPTIVFGGSQTAHLSNALINIPQYSPSLAQPHSKLHHCNDPPRIGYHLLAMTSTN